MPTINIDGLRVNYNDTGTGLPLVFVPGIVGSKEWFRYQHSGLSDHYRIISYDLRRARGHAEYSPELLANDLKRFLDALRLYGAIIVGYSFGALVALKFAEVHPEQCRALIVASASPSFVGLSSEELLALMLPGDIQFDSLLARIWKKLFRPKPVEEDDSDPLMYLASHNADIDKRTLHARLNILQNTDLTPILDKIAAPTLIVAGSMDNSVVLGGSQVMEEQIADSVIEVIENADHFCFYKRHDIFNNILDEYINGIIPHL